MGDKKTLTVAEVASELGFDRSTVYRWIHTGNGPRVFRSPGGHIRVRRADFIEWAGQNNLGDGSR
ncbi:helix-turn-helix transcriptional regulator [Allosalinactinospora lopnorensis]|uniref:helix-turn-helix transcriptional regulator n=1 Tax=Allosalinactinospora lopnorensis TaxID=1352348 RepID=UPI00191C0540